MRGEQPTYTVTDGNNLNMRSGPGTDYDKIGQGARLHRLDRAGHQ